MIHITDFEIFGTEYVRNELLPVNNRVRAFVYNEKGEFGLVECKYAPHEFELAGGGVDEGETLEQCVEREVLEEIGATLDRDSFVSLGDFQRSSQNPSQNCHFIFSFFLAKVISLGEPTAVDEREKNRKVTWLSKDAMIDLMREYNDEAKTFDERRSAASTLYLLENVEVLKNFSV